MENNKLIAEFMGYEVKHGKCYSPKYNDGTIAPMQFDRSWDWLMPVVEKIMWDNDIEDNQCTNIAEALCDAKIDRVYDAVVEFIKQNQAKVIRDNWNELQTLKRILIDEHPHTWSVIKNKINYERTNRK